MSLREAIIEDQIIQILKGGGTSWKVLQQKINFESSRPGVSQVLIKMANEGRVVRNGHDALGYTVYFLPDHCI